MGESSPTLKIVFYPACLPAILIQSLPPCSCHTYPLYHTALHWAAFFSHSAGPPLPKSGCMKTRVVGLVAGMGSEVELGEGEYHRGKHPPQLRLLQVFRQDKVRSSSREGTLLQAQAVPGHLRALCWGHAHTGVPPLRGRACPSFLGADVGA